ncbi:MAG: penicillin-binding transpeptidase domain-containing protein [Leptolinea sp.]
MKANQLFITLMLVLTACSQVIPAGTPTPEPSTPTPTSSLPTPIVLTTSQPGAATSISAFLDAWKIFDHAAMYSQVSRESQSGITEEDFTKIYTDAENALTLAGINYVVGANSTRLDAASLGVRLNYVTNLFGEFTRDQMFNLVMEDGSWKVQWHDGLIMPEMGGGNRLQIENNFPERASVYDTAGLPLASPTKVVALGIVPGKIDPNTEQAQNIKLSILTGVSVEDIYKSYIGAAADWYIPIGEATLESVERNKAALADFPAVLQSTFNSRYSYSLNGLYYDRGIASQVIGYVQAIPSDQINAYKRLGYRGDEIVGVAGLEKSQEKYLAGAHGAALTLVNAQGQAVTRLAQVEMEPSQNITTTLNSDLQMKLQRSFQEFKGAIVVMERDTGRILAMVSSPGYDQNRFSSENINNNNGVLLNNFLSDPSQPLLNRAAQSGYPLGSVFKVITMAAALETGVFTKDSTYDCQLDFRELPGVVLDDWTKAKEYPPSGLLNLPGGLIRSCNPWFWHIGLELYRQGYDRAVSDMSRAFGLGSATGIGQIAEDPGNIPDPQNEGDAVQLAIGQGAMLVTPLQVARFIAAIGNGGTLYKPSLIEKITLPDGTPSYTFQSEKNGTLPVSPENLKVIQDAMEGVAFSKKPLGTAREILASIDFKLAGKTGTATTSEGRPHAWFGGYTDRPEGEKPNIAVAVLVENGGEGSAVAAPFFKRVLSLYYSDGISAGDLLPWESRVYKLATETPEPTATPTRTPTRVP